MALFIAGMESCLLPWPPVLAIAEREVVLFILSSDYKCSS